MAERKLTLIIAGAVSLGAYEAGVLEEILYALKVVNEDPAQPDIKLDVMTGGSAGSITAALVSRVLLHDHVHMKRMLHEGWVKDGDISLMMREDAKGAILSSALQRSLAKKFLLGSDDYPLRVVDPSPAAPARLALGFSLSNVIGVDYGIPYHHRPGVGSLAGDFTTTFFSDFANFVLDNDNTVDTAYWEQIAETAIASGSFPVAFPPTTVARELVDYPLAESRHNEYLPAAVPFYDGGVFNNEPLRQAIDLSSQQDKDILSGDRVFLLVDPNLNTTKQDTSYLTPRNLGMNVYRLIMMALGEIEVRDWMRVGRVNTQLEWRDRLVESLVSVYETLPETALDLGIDELNKQIQKIISHKERIKGRKLDDTYVDERLDRIAAHHADAFRRLGGSDGVQAKRLDLLKRTIFVMNNAAGLNRKSPLTLNVIGSNKESTAGDPFFAFAGFFEEVWREHDYRLGRANAHRLLPELLSVGPYDREGAKTGYNPLYDPKPDWPDLSKVSLVNASRAKREQFLDRAMEKVSAALKEEPLNLCAPLAWAASLFIRSKLKKLLGLADESSEVIVPEIA